MIVKSIVVLSLLLSLCSADTNVTTPQESNYIDETYTNLSKKVLEWSRAIDTTLSSWLRNDEINSTTVASDVSDNTLENKVKSVDSFFQDEKYFNETDNTFVRVRADSYFQSKESNDLNLRVSAQIPFNKSKKNFKIFIDDVTLDNAQNILKDDSEEDRLVPDVGIHYFAKEKFGIESRYSLGLSGSDPFVRARYNMPIRTNKWLIDPVQLFQYSTDDEFEEETNIYFDKELQKQSLFRILLHRKTQTNVDGMDYGLSLQYYWSPKKDTGFKLSQSFWGNTKYQYIVDENVEPPETKNYSGINNYVTSFSWRENIWRKWFYYEVRPGVNFRKQYDYEPNYTIRLFLDFYFGKHH